MFRKFHITKQICFFKTNYNQVLKVFCICIDCVLVFFLSSIVIGFVKKNSDSFSVKTCGEQVLFVKTWVFVDISSNHKKKSKTELN